MIWAEGLWADGLWANGLWAGPVSSFHPGIEYTIPSSVQTAPKIQVKTVSEVRNITVAMPGKLDTLELFSGVPVVGELGTSDLTLTNMRLNESNIKVEHIDTLVGKAVQFTVAGGAAATLYIIQLSALSNSVPPQAIRGRVRLYVEAD